MALDGTPCFCGVTSGVILFCPCPIKRTPGFNELKAVSVEL